MGMKSRSIVQPFILGLFLTFLSACVPTVAGTGAGFSVAYVAGEESATISQWAKAILDAVREEGITAVIGAEPGRSIAAQALVAWCLGHLVFSRG